MTARDWIVIKTILKPSVVIDEDQNNDKDDLECYWYVNKAYDDHIDDHHDDKGDVYDGDSGD